MNSGKPETRIKKASHCVLKTQYRPNVGLEFINSIAFEFFIISSTNWEGLRHWGEHCILPKIKQEIHHMHYGPMELGVRGLTVLWMPLWLTITRHMWPNDLSFSVRSVASYHTDKLLSCFQEINLSSYSFLHQHFPTVCMFTLPQCVEGRWSALIHHLNPASLHFSSADHLDCLKCVTEHRKPWWALLQTG